MKKLLIKISGNEMTLIIVHALILNLFIEAAGRHSLFKAFAFMVESCGPFFYNALMIMTTLSASLLFRRRLFVKVIISLFWILLGSINGVILSFRMTPFTVSDLSLLENGLSILPNYMSTRGIVIMVLGIALGLGLMVLTFLFAPKKKERIPYKTNLLLIVVLIVALWGMTGVGLNQRWLSSYFGNLGYAYEDYGVPYCFFNTWLNRGIHRPADYSEEAILKIFEEGVPPGIPEANSRLLVTDIVAGQPDFKPNILFVQLESFIDPLRIKNMTYSTDPIPNFRELQKTGSTGRLVVPSVGAGTANTEFEILTGMRIKSFGPGEYPYKTVIKDQTCESINTTLKKLGYKRHAIHNHRGAFYDRNVIFSNLGFDTFTSVEYMNRIRLTPKKWAKDAVLENEIMAALESTPGNDFIFAISVQGHGRYPSNPRYEPDELSVRLISPVESEEAKNEMEYYLQQVYEMDQLIGSLTRQLKNHPEPTIVVFYGDHLPVLDINDEDLIDSTIYDTEYVVWANFQLGKIDKNLMAYQLCSEILGRLDIHNGIMTWFHQTQKDSHKYLDNLEALQYDMLYGQKYIFEGKNPFEPTPLQMGFRPIRVTDIFNFGANTYVIGENFTPYSKVALKGKFVETVFVNSRILRMVDQVKNARPEDFSVSQVGKYNTVLSTIKDVLQDVE
ncbi:MAG TPA: sulfatase-like hydrolase/transferase [Clostridiales bacterium]|nr:sulfatase-like hydrolase/transferase [Clostridiales bacterium]